MVKETQTPISAQQALAALENKVNAALHAAEVASAMMDFIHRDNNVPEHIIYAVIHSQNEARALWNAYYASPAWRGVAP